MEPDPGHKLLYLKTSDDRMKERGSLYEAVREAWKVNLEKAKDADYVIAVIKNVCRDVFEPKEWKPVPDRPGRYGFDGKEVVGDVATAYVGKLVSEDKRGRSEKQYSR